MFSYIFYILYVKEIGESKDYVCGVFCVVCVYSYMSNFMCVSEVIMYVYVFFVCGMSKFFELFIFLFMKNYNFFFKVNERSFILELNWSEYV